MVLFRSIIGCICSRRGSNPRVKPYNEQCVSYGPKSVESVLLRALGLTFEKKSKEEREEVLIFIYTNWHHIKHNSLIIEALKNTKFVKSTDGHLHRPKNLFDPGDALLKSLFSSDAEAHKFPGERFVSDGWINILRNTGLQNTRDPDTVLQCARRIEFLGAESMKDEDVDMENQVSIEIWSLAEALISIVFENIGLLHDRGFCNAFGKIACVPAEKYYFSSKSKMSCVKRVVCSYNDAILLKDWPLAWTAAPILTKQSLVPPEYSWDALQLKSPPLFTLVLKHLQANTWHSESSLFTIEEASFEVLKYLDKIWETLSSSDILELQKLAFIAADNGTRLATPGSLFSCMTIKLSPLASKLSPRYQPFMKILKELGVEDILSVSSAMSILSNLRKSCSYYRLNPNELHSVIGLLQFLCDESIYLQTSSDKPNWESELVVPDDGCRLVRPNACVYIDPHGLRYMDFIDTSNLKFVHHDVSERLCLTFGVKKLSDVVVEELDYVEGIQTFEEVGSVSLGAIRLKLLSRSFQVAVLSVVNKYSGITSGFKNPDFPSLKRSLTTVAKRLKLVQRIYTRFWLLPKLLDITRASNESSIPKSSHQALYYVDRSYTCILVTERPNYVSVVDLVASVVSHVLGSPVPLPIGSLFLCPQDSETALVNILKLSCDERVIEGVGIGTGTGFLGRHLLPRDEKIVKFNRLHGEITSFSKGEIVAWKSEKEEKLKYGRILYEDIRLKVSEGKSSFNFNLETSPGMTNTISNSLVFHFKYFSSGPDMPIESENIPSDMVVQEPLGYIRENLKIQRDAIKVLEPGAEEFVKSVEDIFSVAGINVDIEKQRLLQTTLLLHKQLNESQAALVLEQEKSEMATKEANTAKTTLQTALKCRICLTREIDSTLVPCGHVLCRTCTSDVSSCPICGIKLSKTIKLYRS